MLQAFKSYCQRLHERQKSYYAGRRGTSYTIFHNANSMKLSWLSMENERGELVVSWQDVVGIETFKRDLYAVDLICLAFIRKDSKSLELNEEMDGWKSLVDKLPEYFPGCQKFEEWFEVVAFPAFEPNLATIYRRGEEKAVADSPIEYF
jgi:hypothetical protein